MRLLALACAAALGLSSARSAEARVAVAIDLSTQKMHVRSGHATYAWPVSTARTGYATPRGQYRPTLLKRVHYSRKYDGSPMPHSIFFNGGYAIHGTYATRALGRPASHGCIRLAPRHAARLFEMVAAEGAAITIIGSPPRTRRENLPRGKPHAARFPGRTPFPAGDWPITPAWPEPPLDVWPPVDVWQ